MKFKSRLKERVKAAISRKQNEGSTKFAVDLSGAKWFEPRRVVKIDIIPYVVSIEDHPDGVEPGELYWTMPYKLHTGIGSDEKSFVCPKTFNEKCPICEHRIQLMRDDYEENEAEIKSLKARDRMLLQVIDKDDPDAGIMLWDVSYHLFGKKLENELLNAEDDSFYDFADLEHGFTLKVRFVEDKFGSYTFWTADRIDFIPRDEPYDESILEEGYQLDKLLRRVDPEDLRKIAFEDAPYTIIFKKEESSNQENDSEEEEEIREPVTKKRRSKAKDVPPPPPPEDEEEEDDIPDEEIIKDEEPEEEVEEEPKPKRRKRREKKTTKNKCPFGHVFGKDGDRFPDCDECPDDVWEACVNGGE